MIKSKKYNIGCLYLRNDVYYTYIKGERLATPYRTNQKIEALKLLDSRIEKFLNPTKIDTLSGLIDEFLATKKKLDKDIAHRYILAFKLTLPNDCQLDDIPYIRRMIRKYINTNNHKNTYQNKILKQTRSLFIFAIEEGMMSVNPIKKDMYLKDDSNRRPFTKEEVESIIENLDKNKHHLAADLCRFIKITGCRIREAIDIRLTDIEEDFITIHGKGAEIRFFPLFAYPNLKELIEKVKIKHSKEYLFGVRSYSKLQYRIRRAVQELGIEIEYGNFHSIRKYAENDMIFNQNIPNRLVLSIIGHTRDIQDKHYLKKLQQQDLKDLIKC